MILDAENAGLLTQVKDDKSRRAEQDRRNAVRVRVPLDKALDDRRRRVKIIQYLKACCQ